MVCQERDGFVQFRREAPQLSCGEPVLLGLSRADRLEIDRMTRLLRVAKDEIGPISFMSLACN